MKKCLQCGNDIPDHKKFCDRSCSAKYNNIRRTRHDAANTIECLNCGKVTKTRIYNADTRKFCSNECSNEYKNKKRISDWLSNGIYPGKTTVKRWLLSEQNGVCSHCGIIPMWNDKELVFDLEHRDGNSENNNRDNLEVICPNCHSQTDTYKAKNKGNGRHYRRERYRDGKSY